MKICENYKKITFWLCFILFFFILCWGLWGWSKIRPLSAIQVSFNLTPTLPLVMLNHYSTYPKHISQFWKIFFWILSIFHHVHDCMFHCTNLINCSFYCSFWLFGGYGFRKFEKWQKNLKRLSKICWKYTKGVHLHIFWKFCNLRENIKTAPLYFQRWEC